MNNKSTCRDVPCDQSVAERPRYYARQLITADDLTLEQDYFRSKLRLHNRLLHGWGVVCGAEVSYVPKANSTETEPWLVMVKPGYILGPYGDEIYIDCERKVDLRSGSTVGVTGEPCGEMVDPWCNEIYEPRDNGKLYVAVKYKQVATRPVRVQPIGCGCDDTACENSRWRDGYEIRILNAWPDCGATPPNLEGLFRGPTPQCAPCPDEPWVVLAEVTVETDGKITTIDACACRRLAASLMNVWWACTEGTGTHETGVRGCEMFAEFGDINRDDKRAHLDKFAIELQNRPGMTGYMIYHVPALAADGRFLAEEAIKYLVTERGIARNRIHTHQGESSELRIELYICEPGASPPIIRNASAPAEKEPTELHAGKGESEEGGATTPITPPPTTAVTPAPTSTATDKPLPSNRKQRGRKGSGPEPS